MAFWDKIFKKSTTPNIINKEEIVEQKVLEEIKAEEVVETTPKEYSFKFALTSKEEQERIIKFIGLPKDKWDVINLMLAFGVKEENENVLIARTKNGSREDDDTGQTYHTTYFAALVNDECYAISYTSENTRAEGELQYDVPEKYEAVLKGALDYWRQWDKRNEFEKELQSEDKDFRLNVLNSKLTQSLWDEVQNIPKEHFEVTCEEDAKKLFGMCNALYLDKSYDEETVNNFKKYATSEKKKEWALEECKSILNNIINGNTDGLYKKLSTVSGKCNCWISASDDDLSELYTKACKVLFAGDKFVPIACINSYLDIFTKRFNPLHSAELLDITEKYLKEKYATEYEKGDFSGPVQKFKRICAQIRGKIAELAPAENKGNFKFVVTPEHKLNQIVEFYKDKYNNMEAVKEELAYLNCAYGVENEEIFLTASSDAADSLHNQSWDMYDFVAVLSNTKEVLDFRCKRAGADGKLMLNHYNGSVKENWEMLEEAISFFRNKSERDTFFAECGQNTGKNIYEIRNEAHEKLFATFGLSYGAELERIGDNPLGDTLREFVKMCEVKAPENGFDNTIINEPATLEEIEQWEQEHGIKLPESYKNFLLFANGVQVLSDSERIFGITGLRPGDKYLEDDYYPIGCTIGDGTTFCLSKSTGKAYTEDHGEYEDYGDFKNLLEYWTDFLYDA